MQRRKLIRPIFFQDFFLATAKIFYRRFPAGRWRKLRLIAVDGTGCRLPDESWLGETYGWHQNQHSQVPSTRWLVQFDLLNQIIINVHLHSRHQGEITVATPLIKDYAADALVIYDRGFGSYAIPYLHQLYGSNCIIRLQRSFNPEVIDFIQSNENERIVTANMSERAVRSLRKSGHKVSRKDRITYRLIRVDLPSGEVEVLLTTLLHRQYYHHKHFQQLYAERWGVETAIFVLKSYFQAASFSSYTLPAVEQEIWAMFAVYNLQSMLIFAQHKTLQTITQKRKYRYQINRNVTIGLIKRYLPATFLDSTKLWYAKLKVLLKEMLRHLEPIRPRPGRVRNRRIMRATERHIYEPNYKPTL